MRKVLTANHPAEAQMVKDLLEGQGISAEIRGQMLFGARGELPISEASPTVWVPEHQVDQAQQSIAQIFDQANPQETKHWVCENCQEMHETQFTSCWKCETPRPSDTIPG